MTVTTPSTQQTQPARQTQPEQKTEPAPEQIAAMVLQHQVEQFYYAEARMIDERDFHGWLALFTDDTRYLVPIRRNQVTNEFTDSLGEIGIAHFDDDKTVLTRRVTRMASGLAWTEDPPSIQRHLVTNVQVSERENGELEVHSCFQAHRYRLDREVEVFTGKRVDRLRRTESTFTIAARTVYLDHTTVLGNNLNLFL
jgi:3-phenylpropionate/cinnamic acid dioxygenase small subunit